MNDLTKNFNRFIYQESKMSLSSALFKDKLPKELLEQDLAKALNLGILSLLSMKVILVFICVISLAPIFPLSAFCEISRGLPFASSPLFFLRLSSFLSDPAHLKLIIL